VLIAGFLAINRDTPFPGWWALIPTLGTILLIYGGPRAWINARLLSNRTLVWFGLISFPLYLWHWPLLAFARIVEGETPSRGVRLAAVAASIVLAWLTYMLVERQFRFGRRVRANALVLVVGMLLAGLLGYLVYQRSGFEDRTWAAAAARVNAQFVGASWRYAQNDTCLRQSLLEDAEGTSFGILILPGGHVHGSRPELRLHIVREEIGRTDVLAIGALQVTLFRERFGELEARCSESRVLLNGVAVLDNRFVQLPLGDVSIAALLEFPLGDFRLFRARTGDQRQSDGKSGGCDLSYAHVVLPSSQVELGL
jgi:peptidoglycan/LPS O-acetylase OafA/YrhL